MSNHGITNNNEIGVWTMRLDIYQVIDNTDNWPLIETIEADTEDECIDKAEAEYGFNSGDYHWTNPY